MSCNNLYSEAETERFQLATNMYNLLLPNDAFNCKTYHMLILIFAIILYLYITDMYISYLYKDFKNKNASYVNYFVIFIIAHFIFFLFMNILLRYVPYDEAGYKNMYRSESNYGLSANGYYSAFIILVFIAFGIHFWFNSSETLFSTYTAIYILYFCLYIVGLHFLFFMIVIVESFKNNKTPWDYAQVGSWDWTADVSYDSENVFYYKYMNLDSAPWFFNHTIDPLMYNIHQIFGIKNIRQYAYGLFVMLAIYACIVVMLLTIIIFFKNDNGTVKTLWEFIVESFKTLIPMIILFILLTFVVITTDYNTAINKCILLDRNALYKYDLNKLNNVVTPYIKMYDNYTNSANMQNKDYLYNYIVFNVLISYFTNYLNVFDASLMKAEIVIGTPYNTTHHYFSDLDAKFKDRRYFYNTSAKFGAIDNNDRINEEMFKEYYKKIFDIVLEKDIALQTTRDDVDRRYVNKILQNIFKGDSDANTKLSGELANFDAFKISDDTATKDNIILTKDKIAPTNIPRTNNFITNFGKIKFNIYKLFQIFEKFNENIEEYNNQNQTNVDNTKRKDLLSHLQFFFEDNDKNSDCIPYKFLLVKTFTPSDISDADFSSYEARYGNQIKRTINTFILHILSLYKDYNAMLLQKVDADYVNTFNQQIITTFKALKDTQTKVELLNDNTKLIYMYYTLNNFAVPMKSTDNYLKNLIQNNAYKITGAKYELSLIDNKTNDIFKNYDNVASIMHGNGEEMRRTFDTYDNIFLHYTDKLATIDSKANHTASDIIFIYIFKMIMIFIVYKIVNIE